MFFYTRKKHKDLANPVSDVKFLKEGKEDDDQVDRILSYQAQHAYLAAAGQTLHDVATLMIETGMRPEETCRIRRDWPHLDVDDPYVKIPFGKTKATRRDVPLNPAAVQILQARLESAEGQCLFPTGRTRTSRHAEGQQCTHPGFKEIEGPLFPDVRPETHLGDTRVQNGMDLATVAAILGHAKLNMVQRYAHPQKQQIADSMKKRHAELAEFERRTRKTPEQAPDSG